MSKLYRILLIFFAFLRTRTFRRFSSRDELENWQNRKLMRFLRKTLPLSPFYSKWTRGYGVEDWKKYPIIDKKVMMENFTELNTRGISHELALDVALTAERTRNFAPTLGGITVGLSSGTSGHRGMFLVSPKEQFIYMGTILAKVLPGSLFEQHRVAFFLRANSNLYSSSGSRFLKFEFFDLLDSLESHIKKLNSLQPTLLFAPPSVLRLLADCVGEKKLQIKPIKILSVAEVLDPCDEKVIESQFGQKIHQIYQCTEGFLGISCRLGTIHLNEDLAVIEKEYLDFAARKFVPIISDFSRSTQPIIRYRLNDILTERETPCDCGSVMTSIESIEGRCDDLIYFESLADKRLTRVFPDFLRRSVLFASDKISEYQVEQLSPRELKIAIKAKPEYLEIIESNVVLEIEKLCERLQAKHPRVVFDHQFNSDPLKKLRRIKRSFHVIEGSFSS